MTFTLKRLKKNNNIYIYICIKNNISSFNNSLLDFATVQTVWYFFFFFVLFLDIGKYIYMYLDNISILFVKSVHSNVSTIDFNILSGCSGIVVIKFF